ncbi:MAG: CapA family protein, partial [Clostridia bacterium]|nr:CapA family protein [Clostridia bacterium]
MNQNSSSAPGAGGQVPRRRNIPRRRSPLRFAAPILAAVLVFAALALTVSLLLRDRPSSPVPAVTTGRETSSRPETLAPDTEKETLPPETEIPETEPPLLDQSPVSFVAAGDNLIYRPNIWEAEERAQTAGKSEMDFFFTYENVRDTISGADLAFINQETLLCGRNYEWAGYPLFNGPFEVGKTLSAIGFDVINIATNHMLDQGSATGEGIRITREFWETQP